MRGGLEKDLWAPLPTQHTPGQAQGLYTASSSASHHCVTQWCPSLARLTSSLPAPGNSLWRLHLPNLCPRFPPLYPHPRSSGTSGTPIIR